MKPATIVILGVTIGILTGVIWFFNRPVDPFDKSDGTAKKVGFSSGTRYSTALRLSDKVRKEGFLSEADFQALRTVVIEEGDSGQLLALSIILPLKDAEQMRRALDVCKEAILNPNIDVMPERVLSSYHNRNPAVVDEFIGRNPAASKIVEPDK